MGTAVELATLRHWKGTEQKVPWVVLALTAVVITLHAARRTRVSALLTRWWGLLAAGASAFGVYEHVHSNWSTGALSAQYSQTWDSLPAAEQWWLAASGAVGGSPPLAPGFLALSAVCLALSTVDWPSDGAAVTQREVSDRVSSRG